MEMEGEMEGQNEAYENLGWRQVMKLRGLRIFSNDMFGSIISEAF